MPLPWVKIFTEILDDPRFGRLADSQKWRFVQLILIAGECDAEGFLAYADRPMSLEDIAWRLRLDHDQLINDLNALKSLDLIIAIDNVWHVVNFAKRQGRHLTEIRSYWSKEKRKQRNVSDNVRDNVPDAVSDCPQIEVEEEEEEEEEKEEEEEEEEEAEEEAGISIIDIFTKLTYLPVDKLKKSQDALNTLLKAGATSFDVEAAIYELQAKSFPIASLSSIVKPTMICLARRKNGKGSKDQSPESRARYADWEKHSGDK